MEYTKSTVEFTRRISEIPRSEIVRCQMIGLVLISDKEVIQEQFKLEPLSGVLTQDSMRAVCKIQLPDGDWEPDTTVRVSMSFNLYYY